MCGIAGYIGKSALSQDRIEKTLGLMHNRGPDHRDYCHLENKRISLLHSRLSILDLDERSHQPFKIDNCTLIFNGEIYNYLEIRKKLEAQGISFTTTSDTEVLLRTYLYYGTKCVDHFEGMWAFAIYDGGKKRLFLSRDRFGEKPLYYMHHGNGIYFASETRYLKALAQHSPSININRLLRQFIQGYRSIYKEDDTYFEGISELKHAQSAIIDLDLNIDKFDHWKPRIKIDETMSIKDAINGTKQHLLESIRLRLRADVPLAACLSGGIDSASIVSIATKEFNYKVTTFSLIDTDERYNEEDNIMATIRDTGCDHHLINIPKDDVLNRLKNLIIYHDAPIITITYYFHSLLSQAISKENYRVVFSGTAADELFTGYYDQFLLHLYELRNDPCFEKAKLEWEEHIGSFIRNPHFKDPYLFINNPDFREHIYDNSQEFIEYMKYGAPPPFHEKQYCDGLMSNRMLNDIFCETTPTILHEDDLNSSFYSIENRSPFLDSKLFEFAHSIPRKHLIKDGYGKYVLRESMKGILNDKVRLDRRKKGFNASINSMIDLKSPEIRSYLLDERSDVFELIDRNYITQLFDLNEIPNHYSKFIFNFINAKIFLEQN
jgi:asparagine synthase (glutamine-hydrolysing)